MVQGWLRTPGLKRTGKHAHKRLSTAPRSHVAAVGPAWEKRLKNSTTCVGLTIADYAASLGPYFRMLYASVYAVHSQNVHQSDGSDYFDVGGNIDSISPRWHTDPAEVRWMLYLSSMMFLGNIEELHKRFRFGENTSRLIQRYAADLERWRKG